MCFNYFWVSAFLSRQWLKDSQKSVQVVLLQQYYYTWPYKHKCHEETETKRYRKRRKSISSSAEAVEIAIGFCSNWLPSKDWLPSNRHQWQRGLTLKFDEIFIRISNTGCYGDIVISDVTGWYFNVRLWHTHTHKNVPNVLMLLVTQEKAHRSVWHEEVSRV